MGKLLDCQQDFLMNKKVEANEILFTCERGDCGCTVPRSAYPANINSIPNLIQDTCKRYCSQFAPTQQHSFELSDKQFVEPKTTPWMQNQYNIEKLDDVVNKYERMYYSVKEQQTSYTHEEDMRFAREQVLLEVLNDLKQLQVDIRKPSTPTQDVKGWWNKIAAQGSFEIKLDNNVNQELLDLLLKGGQTK